MWTPRARSARRASRSGWPSSATARTTWSAWPAATPRPPSNTTTHPDHLGPTPTPDQQLRQLDRQREPVERRRARAVALFRHVLDDGEQQAPHPGQVLSEHGQDFLLRHALAVADAGIGIGDQAQRGIAEREFAREHGFGMPGHADD